MDYKNNISLISSIDNELYEFIDSRTDRNIARGVDIVENYVSSLNLNEYSIKSFKAKIIHNELEHRRTSEDFQKLLENCYQRMDAIIDNIFVNYLEILKKSKSSPTKVSDLREYEIVKRRQRQDVINRINNLEKDYQAKKAQDEEAYKNKFDDYQASLQEEARKLTIDVNRIKENTIKSYSAEEKELLATDEKKRIIELKEIIKEKRIEGLKLELEQKIKSYVEIREKKIAFLDVKKEHELLMNKQLTEHQEKIAEQKHQIKEIESQIKINSFNYDCNYKIKLYEKLRDSKSILSSLLRSHNDFLYKYELNGLSSEQHSKFKIALLLTKLYQMIVTLYENNIFDPLINVIDQFIEIYKRNNENYGKTVNRINTKLNEDIIALKDALNVVSLDEKTEKRMTKDDLSENVISSITRYYTNVINEITVFNSELQNFMLHIVNKIGMKYNEVLEKNMFSYNECLFLNTHYSEMPIKELGYLPYDFNQEESLTLNEYFNALCDKIEDLASSINNDYQRNVKSMEKQIFQYDNKIEEDTLKHKANMEKMILLHEKSIKKFEENYVKSKKRKTFMLTYEFKRHCNIAKRKMKQKRRVL